jgi:DNA-binding HxlR family transcriptional regulator
MNNIETALCPKVEAAFTLLAKKWTGLILFSMASGEYCFNELMAAIPGLSARLLSVRMRELEEAGLVKRQVRDELSPIRVTYSLTAKGSSLAAVLLKIAEWANN